MSRARRWAGHRVRSVPLTVMRPDSAISDPAMAFSRVDLPEPLLPRTTTKSPGSRVRSTPPSAVVWYGVPRLKVCASSRISRAGSAMGGPRPARTDDPADRLGDRQGGQHEPRGDRRRDEQPEHDGPEHGREDPVPDGPLREQRFAQDDAGEARHDHPDAHLDT